MFDCEVILNPPQKTYRICIGFSIAQIQSAAVACARHGVIIFTTAVQPHVGNVVERDVA